MTGPPPDDTWVRPPAEAPKMIRPSRVQKPPLNRPDTSQMVWGEPPATGIFLSLSAVTNAIKRLSGDQIGAASVLAPSEPAKGRDSSASRARIQSVLTPSRRDVPVNTIRRPLGETLIAPLIETCSGG